jgi:hypothetical protein
MEDVKLRRRGSVLCGPVMSRQEGQPKHHRGGGRWRRVPHQRRPYRRKARFPVPMLDLRCADALYEVRRSHAEQAPKSTVAVAPEDVPRAKSGHRLSAMEAIRPCHMDDRCAPESRSEKVIKLCGGSGDRVGVCHLKFVLCFTRLLVRPSLAF